MLRTTICTATACTLLTASLGMVLAQGTATQPASGPQSSMRAKAILGSKVHIQGGTGVGIVEDIVFSDEGVIDFFVVSDGGKMVTVPWEATKFNFEKRMATIDITQDQYRQIPTYTSERYPDYYTPTYRTQVYKYYGLTPGQERRLERRVNKR